MGLTQAELEEFDANGFVTFDAVPPALAAAAASEMLRRSPLPPAADGQRPSYRTSMGTDNPAILEEAIFRDVLEHPAVEAAARSILRSSRVQLCQVSPLVAYPQPAEHQGIHANNFHTDTQCTREDFEATPRRLTCEMFIWSVSTTCNLLIQVKQRLGKNELCSRFTSATFADTGSWVAAFLPPGWWTLTEDGRP